MLGSDRSANTKTGLIAGIIAAVLFASAFIGWGIWQAAEYDRQADDYAEEYAAYTDDQIRKACLSLTFTDMNECIAEARHEQRANERNERDLVAQRKSALWAYIMGAAAVIGMGLSVIGVFLVWTTFAETRKANEIALDTERPWLDFSVGENGIMDIHHDKAEWFISIYVSNFGNRPALQVAGRMEAYVDAAPNDLLSDARNIHEVPRKDEHWITVFPGMKEEELSLSGRVDIPNGTRAMVKILISLRYYDSVASEPKFTARSFDLNVTDTALKFYGMEGGKIKFDIPRQSITRTTFRLDETHHVAGIAT